MKKRYCKKLIFKRKPVRSFLICFPCMGHYVFCRYIFCEVLFIMYVQVRYFINSVTFWNTQYDMIKTQTALTKIIIECIFLELSSERTDSDFRNIYFQNVYSDTNWKNQSTGIEFVYQCRLWSTPVAFKTTFST